MLAVQNIQERAIYKIEEINLLLHRFIDGDHIPNHVINFFNGLPGAGLFLYWYAQYRPEKAGECHEKIVTVIENAFDYISETPEAKTTFCNGIPGTLWLTEYMRKKAVIELDDDYLSTEMLEYLNRDSLSRTIEKNHCDLLYGGFGFWAFLLESGIVSNKRQLIQQQLDALDKIAIDTPNGRNWKINRTYFGIPASIDHAKSIHLSLAHGNSAILVLLAKTMMNGFGGNEVEENIHRGLQLIRSLKITGRDSQNIYPAIVANGAPVILPHLSWRYSDLCVAVAFWMAWKATEHETYKDEALFIIDFCCENDVLPRDAGLSNGAAGIAQIFRRFYWETGNVLYKNAADKWMTTTLRMAVYNDGYAGYKAFNYLEQGKTYQPDYGFLQGITGIGLALLSSLSDKHTDWDRALLIC